MLELRGNLDSAKEIRGILETHGFPLLISLKSIAWRRVMASNRFKRFGGARVEDPIYELDYIFRKIEIINQGILGRQLLLTGTAPAMRGFKKMLDSIDGYIKKDVDEIIRRIPRVTDGLRRKDIIKTFREPSFYAKQINK